jgi:hypothetical protein
MLQLSIHLLAITEADSYKLWTIIILTHYSESYVLSYTLMKGYDHLTKMAIKPPRCARSIKNPAGIETSRVFIRDVIGIY